MDMRVTNVFKAYGVYGAEQSTKPPRLSRAEEKKDVVAMSSEAKDFHDVKKALANVPDIRDDKVQQIKLQMEADKYTVSSEKIADEILSHIIL